MPTRGLIKYFHLAVEALNSKLVEDFQAKDNPREVRICVLVIMERLGRYRTDNGRQIIVIHNITPFTFIDLRF